MVTLYRKYRPLSFGDIIGQNHIKTTLGHEISSGKIAHAYLFCGPRGIGKTTIARILAKSINCENRKEGEHEPCNECNPCNDLRNDKSLDIIEIDAASHTGIDNVRENIISVSRIAPSSLKYKVFIIDEVHMLSNQAFNALLKILEEPPKNVIFILCTTETHKIPATIISRCQRFDFKKIGVTDVVKKLQYIANKEEIKISPDVLESIARHADGHMRDAESLLGQVMVVGGKNITQEEAGLVIPRSDLSEILKLMDFLIKKDAGSAIGLLNDLIGDGVDIKRFLSDMIEMLRKVMLFKTSPLLAERVGAEFGEHIEKEVNKLAQGLDMNKTILYLEKFLKVRSSVDAGFIVQLPVEIAIIELCMSTENNHAQLNSAYTKGVSTVDGGVVSDDNFQYQKKEDILSQEHIVRSRIGESGSAGCSRLISKEEIEEKWNEFLAKVKQQNHSLSFILRICQPKDIQGNKLCLAFRYKFHKDRVGDTNIKRLIESILRDVYKEPIIIEAVIDESVDSGGVGFKTATISDGGDSVVAPKIITDSNVVVAPEKRSDEEVSVVNDKKNESGDNTTNNGKMIENLLKTFGGEVVG